MKKWLGRVRVGTGASVGFPYLPDDLFFCCTTVKGEEVFASNG